MWTIYNELVLHAIRTNDKQDQYHHKDKTERPWAKQFNEQKRTNIQTVKQEDRQTRTHTYAHNHPPTSTVLHYYHEMNVCYIVSKY